MWYGDFETTTSAISTEESNVYLWGLKTDDEQSKEFGKLHWGIDMQSFFNTVVKLNVRRLLFHNLKFDGNYIFKWLLNNGLRFINTSGASNVEDELFVNTWTWLCDDSGSLYSLTINYKGHIFDIRDSWKLVMSSVRDLGKALNVDMSEIESNMEKLSLNYDDYDTFNSKDEVPKHLIDYLDRDIEIIIKSIGNFAEYYDLAMTSAGTAYNDFKAFYGERNFANDFGGKTWSYKHKKFVYENILTLDEWKIGKKSYGGGYTNYNKRKRNKTVYCKYGVSYDINSSYPASMMNFKMPYGRPFYSKPSPLLGFDVVELQVIWINKAVKKNKKAPDLLKNSGKGSGKEKYVAKIENVERTYWVEELEFMKEHYDIDYEIITQLWFPTKYVFKDWVDIKQHNKINAKNTPEKNSHKTVLNSLYGKFGQHYMIGTREIIPRDWTKDYRKNEVFYGKNDEFVHINRIEESTELKYVFIASYVTMKSRMNLFNVMMQNIDIWLYTDTDSCYFSDQPKGIDIHPTRLGAWKPEHRFNRFRVLKPKCYILDNKYDFKGWDDKTNTEIWVENNEIVRRIAGVSYNSREMIDFSNFKDGFKIANGKLAQKNVRNGLLLLPVEVTL